MLGRALIRTFLSPTVPVAACTTQIAGVHHHKEAGDMKRFTGVTRSNKAKANRNTHVNEKLFRKMRGRKTLLVELPEDSARERESEMPPGEMRTELLKRGLNPYKEAQPRVWNEAQVTFQSIYGIADPYVPPETPASFTDVNNKFDEVKQRLQHKFYNWRMGTNRIRKKQGFEKFDVKTFCAKAEDIYERAHKAMEARDKKEMYRCITEYAFAKMWPDVENGSVRFELVSIVEPSRVVAVRCFDNPPKSGNDIAQITVRMHTRQKLALYDRFGGLILGSEDEEKDVVEYVVFENHIAVVDGEWRLHGKIYPKWIEPKQGTHITHQLTQKEAGVQVAKANALPLRTTEKLEEAKKEKEAANSS
ncbi:Protein CBR-MRPL-45 [Caenorhabditis briggsae]|uniref:Large ribosomal subunit protein mL45 n=2 Tax=Caenorhabditis briggsae TaxID=6238 RepID=RM45_CAEBR|nr:Protein CBR-MRPL-45 [Caenorhabditis briggsae]Q616T6.1 RecName: Full=Large ribosomal subunit protein mL45; AltName: Full=39S ribosomal protein L45, mitochondrial; Flags: Precursor [Caenorhabditis briggsae]ULT98566.1 hypothetical protein L3Y34_000140 [Caenorhabditis briggsae]CAP33598.1 Protein CBR-MRPL-45 [Caenorhabditis briggsae]